MRAARFETHNGSLLITIIARTIAAILPSVLRLPMAIVSKIQAAKFMAQVAVKSNLLSGRVDIKEWMRKGEVRHGTVVRQIRVVDKLCMDYDGPPLYF